ncbi:hypothetical protein HDV57DRAFT_464248 [Trichoderma longibrachiatum]|uniref:Uncharacterized protein n=1 Tax=Trichoderma longibrachiatum ATCC 18648 TaxID=983965 RepID=A0A2T4C5K4_TRILO|nr:hypothetical protein M440DRAFT_1235282 [Trichoderma longibrachiatum ATCC 18648]
MPRQRRIITNTGRIRLSLVVPLMIRSAHGEIILVYLRRTPSAVEKRRPRTSPADDRVTNWKDCADCLPQPWKRREGSCSSKAGRRMLIAHHQP